ncbi:hypothetical protein KY290_014644 [Solanum tuberosum]|uniref:Receptor-like serine/threonine-protein kinase n=1 Tax=Solanum tuberosum TaxID=4113 RepID=A0ABQ7VQF2_SOLTU|nr:hypothetical protein KY289_014687 [Solanum tuberosum]KAH0770663.1 hypothetical protein KY290_014644 [Solanum tuberosum]
MASMLSLFTICHLFISIALYVCYAAATDSLFAYQILTNLNPLVSSNHNFVIGFFGYYSSTLPLCKTYLGLGYRSVDSRAIVWVGNELNPLGCFTALALTKEGFYVKDIVLGTTVWIHKPNRTVPSPVLKLLDSGNLVFGDSSNLTAGEYLWQSFDHPLHTLLPGMKLGWDKKTGIDRSMRSWRTEGDPAPGDYLLRLDLGDSGQLPQLVLEKNQRIQSRWGPWDGEKFSGGYALMDNHAFRPIFHSDTDAVFFTFEAKEDSSLILSLNPDGKLQFLRWNNNATNFWDEVKTLNMAICDQYSTCGPYGVCTDGDFPCECPDGFTAASPEEWDKMNFTEGCRRNTSLNYTDKDVFVKNTELKLPDKATYWGILYPQDCEQKCLNKRSCMAYTNININGNGSKCVVWLGDLLDMRRSRIAGNDIFIRMANGKPDAPVSHGKRKLNEGSIAVISVLVLEVLISISYIVYTHRAKSTEVLDEPEINQPENSVGALLQGTDVIAYDSSDLAAATDNFSLSNKIGHGGFGNVYKGVLENGVEIAVKKQDVALRQGVEEFENEVKLIANLQHRNLTKLLGYCIHGIEKFVVYEFMANKSLDKVIFDAARRATVTWPTRLNIIKGIARGLVYMHHDSRLTVIHRDLKASNVLLDSEMTPKISDFGLAREFEDDVEVKTHRVAGTYGYMSPEYMQAGHYSTKSDVFSFGILTLEIVSGQRNSIYRHPTYDIGLVGYAWKIWNEGTAIELLDPLIDKPDDLDEVLGCIHVGILCCQQRSQDRPSMVQVVSLLEENEMLKFNCVPGEPYFYKETSQSSRSRESMNGLSITEFTGRS